MEIYYKCFFSFRISFNLTFNQYVHGNAYCVMCQSNLQTRRLRAGLQNTDSAEEIAFLPDQRQAEAPGHVLYTSNTSSQVTAKV